jgi:hypothetical protein
MHESQKDCIESCGIIKRMPWKPSEIPWLSKPQKLHGKPQNVTEN